MLHEIDLRRLAELEAPDRAFLTLYGKDAASLRQLDTREQRLRALLTEEQTEGQDDLEHFDRSMEQIRSWLDENPVAAGEGFCVFACWGLDFLEGYSLAVPPKDGLWAGSAPYIRPLAELQEENSRFVVVAADNRATRIYLVTEGTLEEADRVRGDVKNRVKVGGWSQKRYARRRENQLAEYAKEIAAVIDTIVAEHEIDRIVLLGSDETIRELTAALPTHVGDLVVGEKAIDLHDGEERLVDEALGIDFEAERASEAAHWQTIRGEYLSGGLAVVGPEDVLAAAREGRVELAVVTRDAEIGGVHCRACEMSFAGSPTACPICAAEDVFEVDLVDALARMLETTSATLDFTDPMPGLTEVGHVAALLRY